MLAIPRSARPRPRYRTEPKPFARGARMVPESLTFIPADCAIRPLRDQLIIEPLEVNWSAIIQVVNGERPVRGIVKAVGPGVWLKGYDHPDKQKRTKMWDTEHFRPTEVNVGDIVELGRGSYGEGSHEAYAFEAFYWGDKLVLMGAREEDVAMVRDGE